MKHLQREKKNDNVVVFVVVSRHHKKWVSLKNLLS